MSLQPTEAIWADLQVDDYIRDGQGVVWRICAIDLLAAKPFETSGAFRCKNREGEWLTISPKPYAGAVTKMVLADDHEHLVELLRDKLGARVIATKQHTDPAWTCEPWPAEHAGGSMVAYREHLDLVHGMYATDIKTFAKLVEAHEAAHDEAKPHIGKSTPHTHRR